MVRYRPVRSDPDKKVQDTSLGFAYIQEDPEWIHYKKIRWAGVPRLLALILFFLMSQSIDL